MARPTPNSFADIVEKLSPSVVNVQVRQQASGGKRQGGGFQFEFQAPPGSQLEELFKQFREQQGSRPSQKRERISQGSGFIVSSKGLIVTNNHVIDKARSISVILEDGTRLQARVVGRDTSTDLALLRVKHKKDLPAISWGDSDKTRVGDWVIAIGNPLGFGGSVTAGIVSARGRNIRSGPYDDFIQTDAPINRGNSGGPLFDLSGKVIGINTAIVSPSGGSIGIGFAIPSALARNIVEQLERHGEAQRAWMGIAFQPLTPDIAESVGLKSNIGGIIVSDVAAKSPASKAGLKSGDVITAYNRKKLSRNSRLPLMVAETPIGTKVPVEVWRDGKRRVLSLTVARLRNKNSSLAKQESVADKDKQGSSEDLTKSITRLKSIGIGVIQLTADLRTRNGIPKSLEGLLIVEADGVSNEKGLRRGLIIREIDGHKVTTGLSAQKIILRSRKSGKKAVLLKVSDLQGKQEAYVGVTIRTS